MAKLKVTTNAKAKETPKGKEAAAKAARLKVIEGDVAPLVKIGVVMADHMKKTSSSQKGLCVAFRSRVKERGYDYDEARQLGKTVFAKIYTDGDESLISPQGNGTANSLLSRVMTILFPADKKAEKEVEAMLEDEGYTFSQCHQAAQGKGTRASIAKKGKQGGARKKKSKTDKSKAEAFETEDAAGDNLSAWYRKAWNGDGEAEGFDGPLDSEEIDALFAKCASGFLEMAEEEEEDAPKKGKGKGKGKKATAEEEEEEED